MTTRTRRNDVREETHAGPAGPPDGPRGETLRSERQTADRLIALGDAAIDRALSGNSERFLMSNRQSGGQ